VQQPTLRAGAPSDLYLPCRTLTTGARLSPNTLSPRADAVPAGARRAIVGAPAGE
jgi:hypothetical protein